VLTTFALHSDADAGWLAGLLDMKKQKFWNKA